MHQFKNLFNTTRLPGEKKDKLDLHFRPADEGSCPNHIIVLFKGQFYKFVPFNEDETKVCSFEYIESAIVEIEQMSNKNGLDENTNIGVLSCDDRDSWFKNYQLLEEANPKVTMQHSSISSNG